MSSPVIPEPWRLGVTELLDGYRAGRLTPAQAMAACLHRVDEVDGELHAVTEVAVVEPVAFDGSRPLSGVPFGVKDLVDVAGQVTRAGSQVLRDALPAERDAAVVARLRELGAVPLLRTATHEFAWGITNRHPETGGPVNPHDHMRVAGGSSGGSAVAVAAGMVPFALGTDTGGSVRIPAAWCGVQGWKPTRGTFSTQGVVPLARSFDTVGLLTRSFADLRLLATLLAGLPEERAATLRVGVPAAFRPGLPADLERCLAQAVARLESTGLPVRALPPFDGDAFVQAYRAVQPVEALAVHRDELRTWPSRAAQYSADVAERLRAAESVTAEQYRDGRSAVTALALLPDEVDVLLLPVAACGPSRIDHPDLAPGTDLPLRDLVLPFTVPASVTGAPVVVVPAGSDADGLPVGLQVVARPGADHLAFAVAELLTWS